MSRQTCWQCVCAAFYILMLSATAAVEARDLLSADDSEIDARLHFLESRLTVLSTPSSWWQHGWTGFYGVSTAAQLYQAIDEDDSDDSTRQWVGAIKSAAGLALTVLKPLPVVGGLPGLEQLPVENRQQKLARLAEAESLLQRSSQRAAGRFTWKPHLLVIGLNLFGAAAIVAFGDSDDAPGSAALGIAVGEAAIWTQPTAAEQYWQTYQQQFNGKQRDAVSWRIVPGINRISLQVNF